MHFAPNCIGMTKYRTVRYMGCVAVRWKTEVIEGFFGETGGKQTACTLEVDIKIDCQEITLELNYSTVLGYGKCRAIVNRVINRRVA